MSWFLPLALVATWSVGNASAQDNSSKDSPSADASGGAAASPEKAGTEGPAESTDATASSAPSKPEGAIPPVVKALRLTMSKGDLKAARFVCDMELQRTKAAPTGRHQEVLSRCSKVYLAAGDALAAKGSVHDAHLRWERAASLKPELRKDFLFLSRLKAYPKTAKAGSSPKRAAPRSAKGKGQGKPDGPPKPKLPPEPPGPRGGTTMGLGLSGGFDGLLGVVASFLYKEQLSIEVAVGILFPVIDTRVRFYGMKAAVTPVVGFGMTTPLAGDARFELDVPGYTALYQLGQTLHVDIGVSWRVWEMDLFGGMSFISSLDQEDVDRLLFFPQFGAQAQFLF